MKIEPRKIMCLMDLSFFTNTLLSYGAVLAKNYQSKLYLCHVISGKDTQSGSADTASRSGAFRTSSVPQARDYLQDLAKDLPVESDVIVTRGDPVDEIQRTTQANNIDMVMAATHGVAGAKRFWKGSVTKKLIKALPCPILVLHARRILPMASVEQSINLNKIVVGCDLASDSSNALDHGLEFAEKFQAQLHLIHVIKPTEFIVKMSSDPVDIKASHPIAWSSSSHLKMDLESTDENQMRRTKMMNQLKVQLTDMMPEDHHNQCPAIAVLLDGEPHKELINYAKQQQIDMIVLGTRNHSILKKFMVGSITDKIIQDANCPVLTIPEGERRISGLRL